MRHIRRNRTNASQGFVWTESAASKAALNTSQTRSDNVDLPADVLAVKADAGSLTDIDRVADRAGEYLGSLDLPYLNAGISRPDPIESIDETAFDALFDTNVKGNFFTLQKMLPLLNDVASVVFTVGEGLGRP